jgi:large subunit ribosomal protein L9
MAKLLLIEDVEALGRSGEIVSVKPGYARNFLLPQGLGVLANKQALRQQEKLKEEREKRALEDKKESNDIAAQIEGIDLITVVKVDHDGHMYGSVTTHEVMHLLQEQKNITLDKKNIQLKHAIKATGVHPISVKLKEGVVAEFNLKVMSEEGYRNFQAEKAAAE